MINNLRLKNFKCFDELQVEMSNLNVLAGINSMGKSSMIQALLLLRQSFEMNAIYKGLHLNGSLTQVGTGFDLLYRKSNEEFVEIEIEAGEKSVYWQYKYDGNSDYQKIEKTNLEDETLEKLNLFRSTFSYISAERIGPQRFYSKSYHEIYEKNQVGFKGELYADYLAERGMNDKVENEKVLHKDVNNLLLFQTEAWLSEISPGIRLDLKKYKEPGLVSVEYKVDAESYTPVNVGFGLSYVAPIVVALLKAKKGDLVILENPEAHLHPKGQRRMGELIAKAAAGGAQIVVETHSDHLLNGIRLSVKNKSIKREMVKLNYFYQASLEASGLTNKWAHRKCSPAILEDGRLSDWPDGFFDEWDKALDELL